MKDKFQAAYNRLEYASHFKEWLEGYLNDAERAAAAGQPVNKQNVIAAEALRIRMTNALLKDGLTVMSVDLDGEEVWVPPSVSI